MTISEPARENSLDIDAINNGQPEWGVPVSLSVSRTAESIVGAVRSLLRLSTEVILIDPYFRLSGNQAFSELVIALQDTLVRSVCIVSTINARDPQRVYEREYRTVNGKGVALEWVVAPDQYFHDRYLLTDVGAIRAGHGFMSDVAKGTHSDQLNLNLIGTDEARRTFDALQNLLGEGRATKIRLA